MKIHFIRGLLSEFDWNWEVKKSYIRLGPLIAYCAHLEEAYVPGFIKIALKPADEFSFRSHGQTNMTSWTCLSMQIMNKSIL